MAKFTEYAPGTPNWIDLSAHDGEAAGAWYADLFGWTCTKQETGGGPPYWMFTLDGESVAGMGEASAEAKAAVAPPSWNSYVAVADVDAVAAAVTEHGGSLLVPPMDVMGAGRMAWAKDPEGTDFALWQAGDHAGCGVCNEPNTFCWNELNPRSIDAVQPFYEGVLGWTFRDTGQAGMKMIDNGDAEVAHALQIAPEWGEMPPRWAVYFAVADLAATIAKVEAAGGSVLVPPVEIPVGTFSLLADPQGASFYVIQLAEG